MLSLLRLSWRRPSWLSRSLHTSTLLRNPQPGPLPPAPEVDPFKVLGIDQKATLEDARKSYYRLALRYHPDTTKEDPSEARVMFQRVGEAYRIISERPEFLDEAADGSEKSQVCATVCPLGSWVD